MERIAIIGLGLIGGSLGLALKKAKATGTGIVGFSRRWETIVKAKECGVIDQAARDLASAVAGANLVIIATPVMTIKEVLERISEHLLPECVVTDTGSTKAKIMQWADEYLPPGVSFIGGHPMAGKETSGVDEADADLFRGCVYCLTPAPEASSQAIQAVVRLVETIGAKPLFIDAEEHDNLVAGVSHLPILLSAAFVSATIKSPSWAEMSKLAARGYRDLSRLASGNPGMSRDICLTNQEQIVYWIGRYIEELGEYRRLIGEDSEELGKAFARAREARERWLREEKQ